MGVCMKQVWILGLVGLLIVANAAFQRRSAPHIPAGAPADVSQRVERAVDNALAHNKTEVALATFPAQYAGATAHLVDAVRAYSVVVATPIYSKSAVHDGSIVTWYQFNIDETVSSRPFMPMGLIEPPVGFPVPTDGQFLIDVPGGEIHMKGVKVTEASPFSDIKLHQKYLMFVSIGPDGHAYVGSGPAGIFKVDGGDSDSLS